MNDREVSAGKSPQELIRGHEITLRDRRLLLRPMTENDWPKLFDWNNDPEVLYFAEDGDVTSRSLEEVQFLYRSVSQVALMFMIELGERAIGECWLQEMNLDRVRMRFPALECRRIDIMIGEKSLWGHGYGSRAIRLLTQLAFGLDADAVFGFVSDYNARSRRAFEKVGYQILNVIDLPESAKGRQSYDLVVWRNECHSPGSTGGKR